MLKNNRIKQGKHLIQTKPLVYTVLVILIISIIPLPAKAQTAIMRNVAITIMVYPESVDSFLDWVQPYTANFRNFTIVIGNQTKGFDGFDWYLQNLTRINALSAVGEVIPLTGFVQVRSPQERIDYLQRTIIDGWINSTGSPPHGIFAFQPDTFVSNWLKSQNVSYIMGYAFDQFEIDWMTMRGGWQLPYYASEVNALMPENQTNGGMVVLPWVTWDWIDSFTLSHIYNTHPVDVSATQVANRTEYLTRLLDENLAASQPLGYSAFSFEYDWLKLLNRLDFAGSILSYLINNTEYRKLSVGNFSAWFKQTHLVTPNYRVNFRSPNSNQIIEWFYNQNMRLARVNNAVVSFIDYSKQPLDIYLQEASKVNFTLPSTGNNTIDNSVKFTLDALGGGQYRAPPRDEPISYSSDLSDFPSYYEFLVNPDPTPSPSHSPSPPPTPSPNPQPTPSHSPSISPAPTATEQPTTTPTPTETPTIPKFPSYIILPLLTGLFVVVLLVTLNNRKSPLRKHAAS